MPRSLFDVASLHVLPEIPPKTQNCSHISFPILLNSKNRESESMSAVHAGKDSGVKGEVHPNMETSYIVVFGALSQLVMVRGACNKPFWIYN